MTAIDHDETPVQTRAQAALFGPDPVATARISDCGRFRYVLTRRWGTGVSAVFVLLNPSTADATQDDPTIRRCMAYARAWGCGGLIVLNLYAFRATDPHLLWTTSDPVGPGNDGYLKRYLWAAELAGAPLVAGWGAHAKADRTAAVQGMVGAPRFTALGTTRAGAPRHPLYMPSSATPQPWPGEDAGGAICETCQSGLHFHCDRTAQHPESGQLVRCRCNCPGIEDVHLPESGVPA